MPKKIAVAILHGIGNQSENFSDLFIEMLTKRFSQQIKPFYATPEEELVIQPIYWGSVFNEKESLLWKKLNIEDNLDFKQLRQFVIHFFGDAIAYQPVVNHNPNYIKVHEVYAKGLRKLSEHAGEDAPLIVIAHSLGTVISSNYFYDLQFISEKIAEDVLQNMQKTPLEKGETLTSFYSLGSPLALWSLRYADFDKPILVPSPHLQNHYPELNGKWVNIYDKDDVFGYPLKTINDSYNQAIAEDKEINSGNFISSTTPLSHNHYFKTNEIIHDIGDNLAEIWKHLNLAPERK
ncbi:chemotaxis protein [Fictibacillus nanhaiensis]|uniref:Chemotaxis protein n=1 Tax=Fictibacillus nanhaiensis TaxID=742169 RepID=A0ABS2ZRH4_9BACL|nr:chemotaxis protein [Fictibacillus nanhaiensis]